MTNTESHTVPTEAETAAARHAATILEAAAAVVAALSNDALADLFEQELSDRARSIAGAELDKRYRQKLNADAYRHTLSA